MREGWELKKLGNVCSYDKIKYIGNHLPYVGLEHIQSNTGKFIGSLDALTVKSSTFHFSDKHLLYGRLRPYLNKVLIPNFEGHCSSEIFPIKIEKNILREYLFYWFVSTDTVERINATWTGARMPRANMKEVINFEIPIPPIQEQKQIVTTLDIAFKQIDQAKANLEKNLNNAKELFQSKLNEVFSQKGEGWEEKKLGEIASVEYGFTAKSTVEGTMRYVRITDIDTKGNLILDEKKYIEDTDESRKFQLKNNDIVMARTGATFGKVLLYKDHEPSIFASYLIRIHFIENISNELYWYFSKSQFYWSQANSLSSGSAQPHFNGKALKEVMFSYPKLEKKQEELIGEFKALLDEVENLQTHYQQKLNNLEELKKSILQKAFNGELSYS